MNTLRRFIRESLVLEDVTRQITWEPSKKVSTAAYGKSGDAGKTSTALANTLRSAWSWGKSAYRAYKRPSAKGTRSSVIKTAWQAGPRGKIEKWKIAGTVTAALGLLGWGVLSWFNSSDKEPDTEEKQKAENEIVNFYDSLAVILNNESSDIMSKFRTSEIENPQKGLTLDVAIDKMKKNFDDKSNRLVAFDGDSHEDYDSFFANFTEYQKIKPLIDSVISQKNESGDASRESVLKTYALRILVHSAAYEISEAAIADANEIDDLFGGKSSAIKTRISQEAESMISEIDTKFKNDKQISIAVDAVNEMTT